MTKGLLKKHYVRERARVAANVKRRRERAGWSQQALARAANTHRTYVSLIERSATNPTLLVLSRIATALGVTLRDLVR